MITIELDYLPQKSKKGKGECRILLRQENKTKITPISVRIYKHEWGETIKNIRTEKAETRFRYKELVNNKNLLADEIAVLTEIVSKIEEEDSESNRCIFNKILHQRSKYRQVQSFFNLVECRIAQLRETGQDSTADNYRCALNCFRNYRKKKDLKMSELNCIVIKDFQNYMHRNGLSMNTISLYNRILRAVYNYALNDGLIDEDRRPFSKVFTGREKTRKRALKEEIVKRLIYEPFTLNKSLEFTRDIFMFSIYAQGMAFVDVSRLTEANFNGKIMRYKRSKTGRLLEVELPECALQIIDKYNEKGSPYIFPILYDIHTGKINSYSTALREYNKRLHLISKQLGLIKPLSSYVARHTWASLAKWNGINDTIISEAMGHTNVTTTTIYLASLETETIAAANHTIIDSLMKKEIK